MDALAFITLAASITNRKRNFNSAAADTEFKEIFGVAAEVCSYVWAYLLLHHTFEITPTPMHFLWTLVFLRQYPTERLLSSLLEADEKTIRKYAWPIIDALAEMAIETVSPSSLSVRWSVAAAAVVVVVVVVFLTHTMNSFASCYTD